MTDLLSAQAAFLDRRRFLQLSAATAVAGLLPGSALAQETPKFGGTFIVGCGTEPRHLNPDIVASLATKLVANPMFNKLVGMASDLSPVPDLATSWTVSDDGKVYRFELAEGVKWHDGKPFTSKDVKFTFEKVLFVLHASGKAVVPFVDSIDTPSDNVVEFRLNKPIDMFMTIVSQQGYILPEHVYADGDIMQHAANTQPIGTGPFKFDSWSRGQELVLVRNTDYFKKDQPFVDRIVARFIPDPASRVRALEAGEVDYVVYIDLPPSAIAGLQDNPDVTVTSKGHEAWGSIVELIMNNEKKPFDNVKVRQALAHAIDRDFINKAAYFGLGRVAKSSINSDLGWPYTADVKQYDFDADKAAALLDEAGAKADANGKRFSASIVVAQTFSAGVKAAQIIAEQLGKLGIDVSVEAIDLATAAERVYVAREFDMYIQSLITGPDPAFGYQTQYVSSNIRPVPYTNGAGYRNAEVDALFEKAAVSADRAERADVYKQIQVKLAEDVPVVWLYENVPYTAYRSSFGNLHSWAAESIYNFGDVFSKEGTDSRA